MKKKADRRTVIQIMAAIFVNGYIAGFGKGRIFTGKTKALCVPVLNCYSCPGALGACPIGSLQAVIGDKDFRFSFYVAGFIMLFGVICGRLICGFLCPFGLVQDLLYKVPLPKLKVRPEIDKPLRFLKYIVLVIFVIVMPMVLTNRYGMGAPYFCKLICPAGTLEGGIPLISINPALRSALGGLFTWKVAVLVAIILLSMVIYRPFCKYLCPLGAMYGIFNRFSFYQMNLDESRCIGCKACEKICKMNVDVTRNIKRAECIMCGECKKNCPTGAITSGFSHKGKKEKSLS